MCRYARNVNHISDNGVKCVRTFNVFSASLISTHESEYVMNSCFAAMSNSGSALNRKIPMKHMKIEQTVLLRLFGKIGLRKRSVSFRSLNSSHCCKLLKKLNFSKIIDVSIPDIVAVSGMYSYA